MSCVFLKRIPIGYGKSLEVEQMKETEHVYYNSYNAKALSLSLYPSVNGYYYY